MPAALIPPIDHFYPLEHGRAAFARLAEATHFGKVVLGVLPELGDGEITDVRIPIGLRFTDCENESRDRGGGGARRGERSLTCVSPSTFALPITTCRAT